MKRACYLILTAFIVIGLTGRAATQSTEPPQNLQVLPSDMSRDDLRSVMRGFSSALGVTCGHCHADPVDGERDFAADVKPAKQVARAMLRMVAAINNEYIAEIIQAERGAANGAAGNDISSEQQVRVRCVTCHRGQDHPHLLADVLSSARGEGGIQAAVTRYRELRDEYYGSHTYDFSVASLNGIAEQWLAADQADDALTILELNAEFFPRSTDVHMLMGQAELERGDQQAAIQHLEQAVALDRRNSAARRLLNRLRSGQGGQ